jgi:hypothetical protein
MISFHLSTYVHARRIGPAPHDGLTGSHQPFVNEDRFREGLYWLPEGYAETELRMEKTGESTFSRVLTREGVSEMRPEIGQRADEELAPQSRNRRFISRGGETS